jgi:hypothetical protein
MFLECTAYMDTAGAVRCGLPAHVQYRYTVASTDGPRGKRHASLRAVSELLADPATRL